MTDRTRGVHGRFESTLSDVRAAAEAVQLRAAGLTFRQIAERQGITVSTAHHRVQRAFAAVPIEVVNEYRELELLRLDHLSATVWEILEAEHPWVTPRGEIIAGVVDSVPTLRAIDTLLRLSDARCRLLGLNAPARNGTALNPTLLAETELLASDLGAAPDSET